MKVIFQLMLVLLIVSCKENQTKETANLSKQSSTYAVTATMEGKTHKLEQGELLPDIKTVFNRDSILLLFRGEDNPFQLNFNLTHTDILAKGAGSYTIPEANAGKAMVDLNFFDMERDAKRINKRIVFRKGTIQIQKLTENKLEMTFEGTGSGMLDSKNSFPVSGKINAEL